MEKYKGETIHKSQNPEIKSTSFDPDPHFFKISDVVNR